MTILKCQNIMLLSQSWTILKQMHMIASILDEQEVREEAITDLLCHDLL